MAKVAGPKPAPKEAQQVPTYAPDVGDAEPSPEEIDETLKESFPASDPPSWSAPVRIGKPKRKRDT
jgi:hypothetical protein